MEYGPIIQAAAKQYGIPASLLQGVMATESSGNPQATSDVGAQGLMQLMPATAKALGVSNPYDPQQAIFGAAKLLQQNLHATGGDTQKALEMYHGGTNTANWGPLTQAYPQKVGANMAQPTQAKTYTMQDMDSMFGASSSPSTAQPASPTGKTYTLQQMDALMSGPPPTQQQQAVQAAAPTSTLGKLGAGFVQGVHDVTDWPAQELAKGADAIGLTPVLQKLGVPGATNAQQTTQNDQTARSNFNATTGKTFPGEVGQFAGQIATSTPVLMAGGGLLGAGGKLASSALEDAAPAVSRAITGAGNFLTGTAGAGARGIGGLGARVASRAAAGAAIGAGTNALTGSSSPEPMAGQLIKGAEYGALGGVAAPAVGSALGGVSSVAKNALSSLTDVSPTAVENSAANRLVKALEADGLSPKAALARLDDMGPNATLMDVGGPNVKGLSRVIADTPGTGQGVVSSALQNRMDAQLDRVNQAIENATGQKGAIFADKEGLQLARQQAAQPLYQKAFSADVVPDERLGALLNHPDIQNGLQTGAAIAQRNALAKGEPFDPSVYVPNVGENGQPNPISMKALDAAKQGLDDQIEKYRDPVTGKLNLDQTGYSLNNLRSAFVSHLDQLNPDYAAARAAYAGPSQSMDALNMGQRALTNAPEITSKVVQGLSASDKQFFLSGVTRALQDKINSSPDGANAVRRIFSTPAMRAKIAAAFDDPEAYNQFAKAMQSETAMANTRNDVLKGSMTSRNLLAASHGAAEDFAPHLYQAAAGDIPGAAAAIARKGLNYLATPSEPQLAAQANLLTSTDRNLLANAFERASKSAGSRAAKAAGAAAKASAVPAATLAASSIYGR